MGFYFYLVKNYIEYGSLELIEFIDIYFMLMNYWILVELNNIVCEC